LGIGTGKGENRAADAARKAVSSPLLEFSIEGAARLLYNITGGTDLTLAEINEATMVISDSVSPDANIIFGTAIDENLEDEIHISVIAAGFSRKPEIKRREKSLNIEEAFDTSDFEIPAYIRKRNK
jgi:cell division protein FtsZ